MSGAGGRAGCRQGDRGAAESGSMTSAPAFLFQAMGPEPRPRHHPVRHAGAVPVCRRRASDHIQRHILLTSTVFEMHQLGLIRPRLPPRAVVLDTGAKSATTRCSSRRSAALSAVIAFEPQRNVFATLQRNLALNDATNVTAVNACSRRAAGGGDAQPGEAGQSRCHNLSTSRMSEAITATTIDAPGPRPDRHPQDRYRGPRPECCRFPACCGTAHRYVEAECASPAQPDARALHAHRGLHVRAGLWAVRPVRRRAAPEGLRQPAQRQARARHLVRQCRLRRRALARDAIAM